jgi:CheY-like chemotaxis protein
MGCTFEIVLPVGAPPQAAAPPSDSDRVAVAGRVLVVDDNVDSAVTLADLLATAGHDVRIAASAGEALAAVDAFGPQVAILDIGLPDMDGYALAERLREGDAPWQGKLIALTGYGQEADKERAAASGFDLHFTKPADPGRLLRAVDQCVLAAPSANLG